MSLRFRYDRTKPVMQLGNGWSVAQKHPWWRRFLADIETQGCELQWREFDKVELSVWKDMGSSWEGIRTLRIRIKDQWRCGLLSWTKQQFGGRPQEIRVFVTRRVDCGLDADSAPWVVFNTSSALCASFTEEGAKHEPYLPRFNALELLL